MRVSRDFLSECIHNWIGIKWSGWESAGVVAHSHLPVLQRSGGPFSFLSQHQSRTSSRGQWNCHPHPIPCTTKQILLRSVIIIEFECKEWVELDWSDTPFPSASIRQDWYPNPFPYKNPFWLQVGWSGVAIRILSQITKWSQCLAAVSRNGEEWLALVIHSHSHHKGTISL